MVGRAQIRGHERPDPGFDIGHEEVQPVEGNQALRLFAPDLTFNLEG
jgi:hypothetical protein